MSETGDHIGPEQAEAEAHREAAERFTHLRKSNSESVALLRGRGAELQAHPVMRNRTELLFDMLFGTFDPEHPEAASAGRLHIEVEWSERLRKMLGRALVESAGTAPEIVTPPTGLHLPPGTNRK